MILLYCSFFKLVLKNIDTRTTVERETMSLKQDCQGRFFFFKDKTQILTVDGRFRIAQLNATLGNEMPT